MTGNSIENDSSKVVCNAASGPSFLDIQDDGVLLVFAAPMLRLFSMAHVVFETVTAFDVVVTDNDGLAGVEANSGGDFGMVNNEVDGEDKVADVDDVAEPTAAVESLPKTVESEGGSVTWRPQPTLLAPPLASLRVVTLQLGLASIRGAESATFLPFFPFLELEAFLFTSFVGVEGGCTK